MEPELFLKKFYSYLMKKYNWSPEQIDQQDFFLTLDLETGDWLVKDKKEEVIQYADQLPF